jgi:hypothetical protein
MSDLGRKDMSDSTLPSPASTVIIPHADLNCRGPGEDHSRQPEVYPSTDQGDPHRHC